MDNNAIMERYTEVRKSERLSIRKFAEALGVSQGVVSNIEYKKLEKISDLYINVLCDKFNINEHWLRTGEGEMYKKKSEINGSLQEIMNIFDELTPELQEYILLQTKQLLQTQEKILSARD